MLWVTHRASLAAGTRVARLASPLALLTLLSAGPARCQSVADSLLDRAAKGVAAARTMKSSFEQSVTNPDLRQTKTSKGEFGQQGASRFAMRFTDPPGDAIVADGQNIWVYLPSAARGQAMKLPLAQGAQLDLFSQLLTSPKASYKVTDGGRAMLGDRAVQVVRLEPKVDGTPFSKAVLWIDRESALVHQLEATELSGMVRKIRFLDIRTDVDLPAGFLKFTPPDGVKVMDMSGLFGGVKPPAR